MCTSTRNNTRQAWDDKSHMCCLTWLGELISCFFFSQSSSSPSPTSTSPRGSNTKTKHSIHVTDKWRCKHVVHQKSEWNYPLVGSRFEFFNSISWWILILGTERQVFSRDTTEKQWWILWKAIDMQIMSKLIHSHVIPNLYDFLLQIIKEKCFFVHTMKVNQCWAPLTSAETFFRVILVLIIHY